MQIGPIRVGGGEEPLLVAEMSGNHNQSLDRALAMLQAAAEAGVRAVKLQTYTAETLTIEGPSASFLVAGAESPWQGQSLKHLYQQAFTPWDWHPILFQRGRELGLTVFSSPFDEGAVEFLESLDCPCYKIASFENIHLPLLTRVAATGKPVIVATGLAELSELARAVSTLRQGGCQQLALLKCTSAYPACPADMNLKTIPNLRETFQVEVGLSDHSLSNTAAVVAVALGATIVEKHFTLSRADGGVDSSFSYEPREMAELAVCLRDAWKALGKPFYGATVGESGSLQFRPSLYISQDLQAGETLTRENLRIARPALGLHPHRLDEVLGRSVRRQVSVGTPLSWDLI